MLDSLWGGRLERFDCSIADGTASLKVRVLEAGIESRVNLELSGIAEISIKLGSPRPWEYAEITEAWLDALGTTVRFTATMWSEQDAVEIIATEATLNGRPVVP